MIFVFLVQKLFSSDNLLLKGWFYSVIWWFIIYAISHLYKVPELTYVPLKSSFSNFIGASLWGLVMAYVLKWQDDRVNQA